MEGSKPGCSMRRGGGSGPDPARWGLLLTWSVILFFLLGAHGGAQEFTAYRTQVDGEIHDCMAADLDGDGSKELLVSFTEHRKQKMRRNLHFYGWKGQGPGARLVLRRAWEVSPGAVFWDTGPADKGRGAKSCYFLSPDGLSELVEQGESGLVPSLRVEAPVLATVGQEDEFLWLDTMRDWNGDGRVEALLPLGREARFYGRHEAAGWERVDSITLEPFPYYNNNILFGRRVGGYQYMAIVFYPLLEAVDLNGDGRQDLLALRDGVGHGYLRKENGKLEAEPFTWPLEIRSEEERIRRRATLSYRVADLNRDGCADVVVHKIGMSFMSWSAETAIFLGRPDGTRPGDPDQRFPSRGLLSGVSVEDLDGDGYADMTKWSVRMGVWPMVEILLRRAIHLNAQYCFADWPQGFSGKPASQRDFELHIDSDRPDFIRGLVPQTEGDFDQDGRRDLVAGYGEDRIGIFLGGPGRAFESRPWVTLEAPGINYVSAEDLDGDGRCDLYGYQVEETFSVLHVWLQGSPTKP
jgi:hypothetical protein